LQVKRIYVEKKEDFNIEAKGLYDDLRINLGIEGLKGVRIVNRYDVEGMSDDEYLAARDIVFCEPPVDRLYEEDLPIDPGHLVFAIEYLPGQYDQRADSAAQCMQIITHKDKPVVKAAKLIILEGDISQEEFQKIKNYCINPIESREASLDKPESLQMSYSIPEDVQIL